MERRKGREGMGGRERERERETEVKRERERGTLEVQEGGERGEVTDTIVILLGDT